MTAHELADMALEEAKQPLPARDRPITTDELIGLWLGDQWSTGYLDFWLAYAIVSKLQLATASLVLGRVYPGVNVNDIPRHAVAFLSDAHALWDKRRKAAKA